MTIPIMSTASNPSLSSDPLQVCAVLTAGGRDKFGAGARLYAALTSLVGNLERIVDRENLRLALRATEENQAKGMVEHAAAVMVGTVCGGDIDAASISDPLAGGDLRQLATDLVSRCWGRYALFGTDAKTGLPGMFCDPSGAFPLFAWVLDDVLVVADALTDELIKTVGFRPGIDWAALARLIARPTAAAHLSGLTGITILTPGMLYLWDGTALRPEVIWDPARFVRVEVDLPAQDHGTRLRETLIQTVDNLSRGHDRLLLELSGGLDSAILLGCLAQCQSQPEIAGLNIAPHSPGGDESAFARAAATQHGVKLVEAKLMPFELDYRQLCGLPRSLQPPIYGTDIAADRISADTAAAFGASAIMTGQGGDAVLFQPATALIAADYHLGHGIDRRFLRLVHQAALRTQRSFWTMLGSALFPRDAIDPDAGGSPPALAGPAVLDGWARPAIHPWVAAAGGSPPAKRFQIALLANCQIFNLPTLTSRTAARFHPLLAQPVIEACLAIPAYDLAPDGRDRGLARDVFAPLLPPMIAGRRGKGEASGFYNRVIVEHLGWIRPLLLDGLLVEQQLIDRAALDMRLDSDHLMWSNDHRMLSLLVVLELWARRWA